MCDEECVMRVCDESGDESVCLECVMRVWMRVCDECVMSEL